MCNGENCCKNFAKVLLIIINIIFLLAGLLMLALGISLVVAPEKVLSFLSTADFMDFSTGSGGFFVEVIKAVGVFMIILGSVVAIIAFFGFFGACCDSKCMLVTYAIILIIIVLAEIALIIFAAVYPTVFKSSGQKIMAEALKDDFKRDLQTYGGGNKSFALQNVGIGEKVWHAFQVEFQCCGSNNYTDYQNFNWNQTDACTVLDGCPPLAKYQVPITCCKVNDPTKFPSSASDFKTGFNTCLMTASSSNTNLVGCFDRVASQAEEMIKQYSKIAIGIAAGIVGLEIILITLAFIMCCMRDRSSKYV